VALQGTYLKACRGTLNLAYRWFCRLGLDDKVPDHSTFSVNRHGRFRDSDIFRQLFEAVVKACMDAGLVKGEGFAIDASVMEADASRNHGQAPGEIDWSAPERQMRAVAEFLSGLDDEDPNEDRKIPPMEPASCLLGSWARASRRIFPCGRDTNQLMACSPASTSLMTPSATSISVRTAKL
jgi:hypothetical protein